MGMTQEVKRCYKFKRYVNSDEGAERLEYPWKGKPERVEKRDCFKHDFSGPCSAPGRRVRSFCSVCMSMFGAKLHDCLPTPSSLSRLNSL